MAAQAAEILAGGGKPPDVFFASDMLDLPVFLAALGRGAAPCGTAPDRRLRSLAAPSPRPGAGAIPSIVYFHENQLTYPLPPGVDRDLGYGFKNVTSALAAEMVLFNSDFHRREFLAAAGRLLAGMPDAVPGWAVEEIAAKSSVLPLGCDLRALDEHRARGVEAVAAGRWGDPAAGPLIVWYQRWEYDKAPEELFRALEALRDQGVGFRLAVAGSGATLPSEGFVRARAALADRVVRWGRLEDRAEFFGVAVLEAIYCGCRPVLPRRLSYPELIPADAHGEVLYGEGDLVGALTRALAAPRAWSEDWQRTWVARFDWGSLKRRYDDVIGQCGAAT